MNRAKLNLAESLNFTTREKRLKGVEGLKISEGHVRVTHHLSLWVTLGARAQGLRDRTEQATLPTTLYLSFINIALISSQFASYLVLQKSGTVKNAFVWFICREAGSNIPKSWCEGWTRFKSIRRRFVANISNWIVPLISLYVPRGYLKVLSSCQLWASFLDIRSRSTTQSLLASNCNLPNHHRNHCSRIHRRRPRRTYNKMDRRP
jgi:hypothetical protein